MWSFPGGCVLERWKTKRHSEKHINVTPYVWPLLTSQRFLYILIFKKGHEYTSGIKHIYHLISTTKQSTWNLTYSQSHYIISQKEGKRYFNKTHCSETFDPFSVDLIPLTQASDSGGHRSQSFPIVGEIHLQIDVCEDSNLFDKGCLICWSINFSFFFFLNPPIQKRNATTTKHDYIRII